MQAPTPLNSKKNCPFERPIDTAIKDIQNPIQSFFPKLLFYYADFWYFSAEKCKKTEYR
jgi:hypothetical protein